MPIRKYLADEVFAPSVISAMDQAFDAATKDLKIYTFARKILIAARIIAAVHRGESDIENLHAAALNTL